MSNGTVTKNPAPIFFSSPIEAVTEIEDEVFCTRKFNLPAVINHSGNMNSGHYTCLLQDGETWWAGIKNGGGGRVVMVKTIIICVRLSVWAQ